MANAALRSRPFLNLNDLVGNQAMCFPVHGNSILFAGGLHQAKDPACAFVEPVLEILHTISVLNFQVSSVRTRDSLGCQTFYVLVNIHIEWHFHLFLWAGSQGVTILKVLYRATDQFRGANKRTE